MFIKLVLRLDGSLLKTKGREGRAVPRSGSSRGCRHSGEFWLVTALGAIQHLQHLFCQKMSPWVVPFPGFL